MLMQVVWVTTGFYGDRLLTTKIIGCIIHYGKDIIQRYSFTIQNNQIECYREINNNNWLINI